MMIKNEIIVIIYDERLDSCLFTFITCWSTFFFCFLFAYCVKMIFIIVGNYFSVGWADSSDLWLSSRKILLFTLCEIDIRDIWEFSSFFCLLLLLYDAVSLLYLLMSFNNNHNFSFFLFFFVGKQKSVSRQSAFQHCYLFIFHNFSFVFFRIVVATIRRREKKNAEIQREIGAIKYWRPPQRRFYLFFYFFFFLYMKLLGRY